VTRLILTRSGREAVVHAGAFDEPLGAAPAPPRAMPMPGKIAVARDPGTAICHTGRKRRLLLPAGGLGFGDADLGQRWDVRGRALRPLFCSFVRTSLGFFHLRQQFAGADLGTQANAPAVWEGWGVETRRGAARGSTIASSHTTKGG
jgi:hypothetical protein